MTTPIQIYDAIIESIRESDRKEGNEFLLRYMDGFQSVWDAIDTDIKSLPTIWSIEDCPDYLLKYLKNIVGWVGDLEFITDELDDDTLRKLIAVSAKIWKERGPEDLIIDIMYFIFGSRSRIWNWFDFRWICDETYLGEDHQGYDPWVISLPDPEIQGSEFISNLRIVDKGDLNRTAVELMLNPLVPLGEITEITWLRFLDQFLVDNDDTQWLDPDTYDLTIDDGLMKLGDSFTSGKEIAWVNPYLGTDFVSQIVYFRARFYNNTSGFCGLFPYAFYSDTDEITGIGIVTDFSGTIYVVLIVGKTITTIDSFSFDIIEGQWYGFRFEVSLDGGSVLFKVYIDANLEYEINWNTPQFFDGGPALYAYSSYLECSEVETTYTVDVEEPLASFSDLTFTNSTTSVDRHTLCSGGSWGGNYEENDKPIVREMNRACLVVESRIENYGEYSDDFTQYSKSEATDTVNSNALASPIQYSSLETSKADLFTPSTANNEHMLYRNADSLTSGKMYNLNVCIRDNGIRYFSLFLSDLHFDDYRARFDLQSGEKISGSIDNYLIKPIQKDWILLSISSECNTTDTNVPYYLAAATASSDSFAGDGVSGAYLWGVNLQEGYSSNECGFTSSIVIAGSSPVTRYESSAYWSPGSYSPLIGTRKHRIIWTPHWSTTDYLPHEKSFIYELYISNSVRLFLMWNSTENRLEMYSSNATLMATTTVMEFGNLTPKIIDVDPFNGSIECFGATSGGSSDLKTPWYTYYDESMILYYGHNHSTNYDRYLNGSISEPFVPNGG